MSDFAKKLLFTRQFFINHGNIEVMSRKQVMLSSEIIQLLQNPEHYPKIKNIVQKEMHEICNNFGSKRNEIMSMIVDIFDLYGLGKLEIINMNKIQGTALVNVYNSSLAQGSESENVSCHIIRAVLAGMFSFLLGSDIDCEETKCYAKGDEFCEFVIRGGSL